MGNHPLLSDPNAPPAPRIIPNYERSRRPVYSPELTALLTSTHSRTTKALQNANLESPPIMPPRADPSSEETRLLGPFSKRREVNLHWRYFKREWKKVLPPLQLSVKEISDVNESSDKHDTARFGVRGVGLQGGRVLEEAQILAGPAWKPLSTPRRAKQRPESQNLNSPESAFTSSLPTRWLRKRYQNLLGKVPILTYHTKERKIGHNNNRPTSRYEVSLAPSAISSHIRYGANRLPPVDEANLRWIQLAEEEKPKSELVNQKQGTVTTQNADENK